MTETKFSTKSSKDVFVGALAQIPQSDHILSEYKFALSDRLQEAMEAKGLKQYELANIAQKAESVISHILAADRNVTLRTIAELSAALEVDLLRLVPASIQRWTLETKSNTSLGLSFSFDSRRQIIGVKEEGIYA